MTYKDRFNQVRAEMAATTDLLLKSGMDLRTATLKSYELHAPKVAPSAPTGPRVTMRPRCEWMSPIEMSDRVDAYRRDGLSLAAACQRAYADARETVYEVAP